MEVSDEVLAGVSGGTEVLETDKLGEVKVRSLIAEDVENILPKAGVERVVESEGIAKLSTDGMAKKNGYI